MSDSPLTSVQPIYRTVQVCNQVPSPFKINITYSLTLSVRVTSTKHLSSHTKAVSNLTGRYCNFIVVLSGNPKSGRQSKSERQFGTAIRVPLPVRRILSGHMKSERQSYTATKKKSMVVRNEEISIVHSNVPSKQMGHTNFRSNRIQ